ncbi:hypothetical protein BAE44_0005493 [Dichanthelium oligosanthes]|uniref:No apical meristem-associated C-terminal domain-containing protein n=1 Tax=Dichanthelium oligosanthes TaxID=888268 RepID=A0A1E5W7U0_9POAL|nr:hypothetical protein BAE44_0005493 [Dichanthelium oligosanthes]
MDPVQAIDQSRGTYWERIHDYYHQHKNFLLTVQLMNSSGLTEQDKIQEACILYKAGDPHNRSLPFLHCWNVLQHTEKWLNLPCNNKKQKTSSNTSPRSCAPGTNESHHANEEEGPSHTSPRKDRPDGKRKEKARRGKNPVSHGETLYMKEIRKKKRK